MDDTSHSRSPQPFRPAGTRPPLRLLLTALVSAFALILLTAAGFGDAENDPPADSADIAQGVVLPENGGREVLPAANQPFKPGESLKFAVQYGFINAGNAWLEVPEVKDYNGHSVYTLVARAESNSFFSSMYRVRNRIESYWDRDGRFSWRYAEDRQEGHYRANELIDFDQDRHEARYKNGQTFPIPPEVQDALSSFYFTRFQALPLGGTVVFDYHASKKSSPLEVRVLGRQKIKTPAGRFNCIAIEPMLNAGGIFKNKGRLVIWLTDDERRMPVMMKSKVMIGSISVVLQEVKPGV